MLTSPGQALAFPIWGRGPSSQNKVRLGRRSGAEQRGAGTGSVLLGTYRGSTDPSLWFGWRLFVFLNRQRIIALASRTLWRARIPMLYDRKYPRLK